MKQARQQQCQEPLEALKQQTMSLHRALERELAFPESFATKAAYARALTFFYIFQHEVQRHYRLYGSGIAPQLSVEQRLRLDLVKQDLTALNVVVPPQINHSQRLELDSRDEFYGCLYVSEGSTLGGHIIQREMLKMHGPEAQLWTRYLNPYPDNLMPMWQSFKFVLGEEIKSGRAELNDVMVGASNTFRFLIDVVTGQNADAAHE